MNRNNKKFIGVLTNWNDDLELQITLEDNDLIVKQATQSYSVPYDSEHEAYKPSIGSTPSHNELLAGLVLRSYSVSNNGAYITTKCQWQTPETDDNEESGEEESEDWKIGGKRHSMTVTQSTEILEFSILNHPKYKDKKWGAKDILILTEWLSGNVDPYDYRKKGTPIDTGRSGISADNPDDVYLVMKDGVKSWKCPIITYTIKYECKRIPKNPFRFLGKIAECKGVKMKDVIKIDNVKYDTNYLLSSVSINKMERFKYSLVLQYRQAPPGGWDRKLYDKKYEEPLS